jgi:hypothetical protein
MMPLRQRQESLYEFGCHEGNEELVEGTLSAARVQGR